MCFYLLNLATLVGLRVCWKEALITFQSEAAGGIDSILMIQSWHKGAKFVDLILL